MDVDGYPTDEELERIRKWPYQDCEGMLQFVGNLYVDSGYGKFTQNGNCFQLVTGGWSGNEEVICALRENTMFWALCWEATMRGGLDKFEVPEINMGAAAIRKESGDG